MAQEKRDLFTEDEQFLKGRHIVTVFRNAENFYTVLRVRVTETDGNYEEKEAVVTGYFPAVHEHEMYMFHGQFKDHPRFGRQFIARTAQKEMPQTKQGVITYLSGDLFKGIGKKTAETIVETLGEQAISKIIADRTCLKEVPRLPAEKADMLYDTLMKHQGLEQIMMTLNDFGFGPQLSMKIYQMYFDESLNIIRENPYRLVEDIEGIGFIRADEIGAKIGISGEHPDRLKAAILYTLEQQCLQEGHCYVEAEALLHTVKELLDRSANGTGEFDAIAKRLIELEEEGKVSGEDKRVYMPSLYFSEKGLVTNVQRVLDQDLNSFPESEFLLALGELEDRTGMSYAPSQKSAIQTALSSPLMILTGGPGTGKTTVIKGIVELYGELHGLSLDPKRYDKEEPFPIKLCAPTGRAAKRMMESTGLPAVTIHRLLGFNGQEEPEEEGKEIAGRLLIVDEMSMVDIWLAHQLFKAVPDDMQIVLVGDEDQLPSVGPGQVLKDMLASQVIPSVRLTDVYRQEEGSSIISLAHSIKDGRVPDTLTQPQKDRSFLRCRTEQIPEVIEKVVKNAAGKGYEPRDIQVLAPMYKGPAGIDKLNEVLQNVLNPNVDGRRKELLFGSIKYRIGDKVLQLVNQPEQNVFNGDIGEIISIFFAKENTEKEDMVIVSYEGNEVTYTRNDLNQITHAFCCSIHKSQGSEFPIVILPVVKSYYRMLRRNLLYTAITRSKQFLILCGEEEAFNIGIARNDDLIRKTALAERLTEEEPSSVLSAAGKLTEETWMNVDPMIGMDHVTPYDFLQLEA
ncbi:MULTISPECIES: ATP-dependent RecD-like DNA helicase [Bacillaceae]|uniref:SF1B family DNA helicase RecD2 n=1 Tax=Bacillus sp. 37MA TaxID=1132442 RepID=UPI00036A5725|nr:MULTISPECIES: ATP-dependent RecD-like DNA helicase [Bacillaceae]